MKAIKLRIPAGYFYKGSPEQVFEVTCESLDRGIENARKVFGPDFMLDTVTEKEKEKPKQ